MIEKIKAEIERRRKAFIEKNAKIERGEIYQDEKDDFNRTLARYGNRVISQELFELICFIELLEKDYEYDLDFAKQLEAIREEERKAKLPELIDFWWKQEDMEGNRIIAKDKEHFALAMKKAYNVGLSQSESLEKEPKGKTNPLFEECLANVDPAVRKEVHDNIDKMLEKEQDVDLEKEIYNLYDGEYHDTEDVARQFYDLGCRHAAVLYDDMEKERQKMCEEEKSEIPTISQGLDEAAEEYSKHAPHKQIAKMDFIAGAEWKTQQLQWYHIEDLTIERTDEGDCVASEPLLLGWQGPNRDTCRVVIPKPKYMIGRYEWAIPLSELTKLPKHDTSQT